MKSIICELHPYFGRISVWIMDKFDNQTGVATSITFTTLTEKNADLQPEPSMRISPEEAQQFMDELWRIGLRPSEGSGSAGSLAATQKHLEDMRKIAFKGLEING